MVVDPTLLPEKVAPLFNSDGRLRGTNQEAGYAVSDGQPRGTTKEAGFSVCNGRPTREAGSNVSGG